MRIAVDRICLALAVLPCTFNFLEEALTSMAVGRLRRGAMATLCSFLWFRRLAAPSLASFCMLQLDGRTGSVKLTHYRYS